jgi:predicted nucleic acid-binding protein
VITSLLPLRQRRVFVDSSAYFALLDLADEHHEEARAILTALADARFRQFTTNVLLIEAHALILAELGITPAASSSAIWS